MKSAVEEYEHMCKVEDDGGRLMYRSREWHESARGRRLEKERKLASWHQTVSAPLILDPTAGGLTSKSNLYARSLRKPVDLGFQ